MQKKEELEPLDLLTEDLISMSEAAKDLPTRPAVTQLYRWARRGVRGVVLETVYVGHGIYTSRQAIRRFLARTQMPRRN